MFIRMSSRVKISKPKSLLSDRGGLEFAKKFRINDRELSPISIKMLRAAVTPIAWMPVFKFIGCSNLTLKSL